MSHQTTIQQFRLFDNGNVRLNREDAEGRCRGLEDIVMEEA